MFKFSQSTDLNFPVVSTVNQLRYGVPLEPTSRRTCLYNKLWIRCVQLLLVPNAENLFRMVRRPSIVKLFLTCLTVVLKHIFYTITFKIYLSRNLIITFVYLTSTHKIFTVNLYYCKWMFIFIRKLFSLMFWLLYEFTILKILDMRFGYFDS